MKLRKIKKNEKYIEVDTRHITVMVVSVLLALYLFQIIMHAINDRSVISANTDYETTNDLEIIEVDKSVKNYYTKGDWNFADAFDGLTTTKTSVGITTDMSVTAEDGSVSTESVPLIYTITAQKDGVDSVRVVVETNENEYFTQNASVDIRLINDDLFLLTKAYDTANATQMFKGYVQSDYDAETSMCDIETLTIIHVLIDALSENDNYSVTYNCRTKLNDVLLDDITVAFLDSGYACRLLVDAETHRPAYIVSTVISENNFIELLYDEIKVDYFSEAETAGAVALQDYELATLDDGNIGCKLSDEEMVVILEMTVRNASYGDFKIIDFESLMDAYSESIETDTESEVEIDELK